MRKLILLLVLTALPLSAQTVITRQLVVKCVTQSRLAGASEAIIYQDCDDGKIYVSAGGGAYVEFGAGAGSESPVFTGDPQAPTPLSTDQDNSIATTEFVANAVVASTTGVAYFNGRTGSVLPLQADYDDFFLTSTEGDAAFLTPAEGDAAYMSMAQHLATPCTTCVTTDTSQTISGVKTFSSAVNLDAPLDIDAPDLEPYVLDASGIYSGIMRLHLDNADTNSKFAGINLSTHTTGSWNIMVGGYTGDNSIFTIQEVGTGNLIPAIEIDETNTTTIQNLVVEGTCTGCGGSGGGSGSRTEVGTVIAALSPTHYWPLTETSGTFADLGSSATDVTMSVKGNTVHADRAIEPRGTVRVPFIPGSNSAVESSVMSYPPINWQGDYTLTFVYALSTSTATQLLGVGANGESVSNNYMIQVITVATSGNIEVLWEYGGGTNESNIFTTEAAYGSGFHIVTIRKNATNTTVEMFVDGKSATPVTYTNEPDIVSPTAVYMSVGLQAGDLSDMTGHIGEIALWDSLLTDEQIYTIHDAFLD